MPAHHVFRPGRNHSGRPDLGTVLAMTDYRDVNRANWDERAPAHAASPDYDVQRFADRPATT